MHGQCVEKLKKYENVACLARPSPCRCVVLSLLENWLEVSLSVEFYIDCPSRFLFIPKVAHGYEVYPQKVWSGKVVHEKSYLKNKLGNLGPKSLPPRVKSFRTRYASL